MPGSSKPTANRPWPDAHRAWREGYLKFIQLAEGIEKRDLLDSGRYEWMGNYPLAWVLLASYDHHQEHLDKAVAWLNRTTGGYVLAESRQLPIRGRSRGIRWTRTWVLLLLVTVVAGASAAMLSPILIVFLQEKLGVGVSTLSWAFLPTGLVWAFLPSRMGRLADRFGRKPLMLLALAAAAVTSFLVPAIATVLGLALIWTFQAACYAAGDPAEQALVADLTGRQQRGRAYGLYVMCADLGKVATIGPLGGAWLYQWITARRPRSKG